MSESNVVTQTPDPNPEATAEAEAVVESKILSDAELATLPSGELLLEHILEGKELEVAEAYGFTSASEGLAEWERLNKEWRTNPKANVGIDDLAKAKALYALNEFLNGNFTDSTKIGVQLLSNWGVTPRGRGTGDDFYKKFSQYPPITDLIKICATLGFGIRCAYDGEKGKKSGKATGLKAPDIQIHYIPRVPQKAGVKGKAQAPVYAVNSGLQAWFNEQNAEEEVEAETETEVEVPENQAVDSGPQSEATS